MRPTRVTFLSVVAGAVYWCGLRGSVLTWGATEEETRARLPGDELLEHADGIATRAITIATPASAVWPWLVQMGPSPRGGAYTYDWIENRLGLNMHSAGRVLSEFQHPEVGDTIGYGTNRMRLELIDRERALGWRSEDGNWVWTFILRREDGVTRLVSRNRFRLPTLRARVGMLFMEPASLVMERKMLLGIKQRAERLHATDIGHEQADRQADAAIAKAAERDPAPTGHREQVRAFPRSERYRPLMSMSRRCEKLVKMNNASLDHREATPMKARGLERAASACTGTQNGGGQL